MGLEQTHKKYIELTVRLTRTQIITSAVAAGLVAAAYITYKAWKLKQIAERRSEQVLNMDNAWQCIVCEDNEKTIVYLPCNHLAVCNQCDLELSQMAKDDDKEETCPICRTKITNRLKVYAQ